MGDGCLVGKKAVLEEEGPCDDGNMNPDAEEFTKAAIFGLGCVDLLPRAALDILCHHVELVEGGDVPLALGSLLGHHGWFDDG
jgi:hypothetical protein